ncbi:MAG: hypothetical protein MUF03_09785 [Rubrivivax sp.]|jgi:hypothetical protein|nr:hypothetical protein [Rubrivivax sp.]
MKFAPASLVALAALVPMLVAAPAAAQPVREPKSMMLDLSTELLIDAESAKALVRENIPARVWALYPEGKWTFLSQVEGGMTREGICVVTARVVLLPRTGTVRAVLWRPEKAATAFDAKPGATAEQCRSLAREKLKEATAAVVSALVKT